MIRASPGLLVTARGTPRDSVKDTNICRHGEGDELMKERLRAAAAADVVRLRLMRPR
jgi:hypothetical protein